MCTHTHTNTHTHTELTQDNLSQKSTIDRVLEGGGEEGMVLKSASEASGGHRM